MDCEVLLLLLDDALLDCKLPKDASGCEMRELLIARVIGAVLGRTTGVANPRLSSSSSSITIGSSSLALLLCCRVRPIATLCASLFKLQGDKS